MNRLNFERLHDDATPTSDDNTLTDLPSLRCDVTRLKTSSPVPPGPATKLRDVAVSVTKLRDVADSATKLRDVADLGTKLRDVADSATKLQDVADSTKLWDGQHSKRREGRRLVLKRQTSPGELKKRSLHVNLGADEVSVGGVSEGEVPALLSKRIRVWAEDRSNKTNRTRDGIDVIDISLSRPTVSPVPPQLVTPQHSPVTPQHSPVTPNTLQPL